MLVEENKTDVVCFVGKLPYHRLIVDKLPLFGDGAVFAVSIDFRLIALTVSGIGNTGLCLNLTSEKSASFKEYGIALAKSCLGDLCICSPSGLW